MMLRREAPGQSAPCLIRGLELSATPVTSRRGEEGEEGGWRRAQSPKVSGLIHHTDTVEPPSTSQRTRFGEHLVYEDLEIPGVWCAQGGCGSRCPSL